MRTAAVATELDSTERRVAFRQSGRTHSRSYSSVVVTAGAAPISLVVPAVAADRTVGTLNEAIAPRDLLDAGMGRSALVVGTGYIGPEMAKALAARGCSVTVVERLGQVLPKLDPEPAPVVKEHVRQQVDLRLGADATSADLPGFNLAVVSVGVRPVATLAGDAGAETGPAGALVVDAGMRMSLPGVWADGDCVAPLHRVTGQPAYVPLGTTANKTGRVAAGGSARFDGIVGSAVVKVFDLEVARTELTLAEGRAVGFPALATDVVHRSRAKYYPGGSALHVRRLVQGRAGRLLRAQMVGGEGAAHRIDVLATGPRAGMTVSELASFDLANAPRYPPVYDPIPIAAKAAVRQLGPT